MLSRDGIEDAALDELDRLERTIELFCDNERSVAQLALGIAQLALAEFGDQVSGRRRNYADEDDGGHNEIGDRAARRDHARTSRRAPVHAGARHVHTIGPRTVSSSLPISHRLSVQMWTGG
jgi:hypothetical protein